MDLTPLWNGLRNNRQGMQLAFAVTACIAAAIAALITATQITAYETEATRALEVRALATSLLSIVQDAETGQRGFLLTDDEGSLKPYNSAREKIWPIYLKLHDLVAGEREQSARLQRMWSLADDKLKEVAQTIDLAKHGRKSAALEIVRAGLGQFIMDQFRAEDAIFSEVELQHLHEREEILARSRSICLAIMLSGLVIMLALGFLLLRASRSRTQLQIRALAGDALRESEERFRTLADNINQFAWIADGSGWINWYNKRWYDYTGTSIADVAGWGWTKLHHPDHVERVIAGFSNAFSKGENWEDTFPLRGKDGQYRWFLSRAMPIRDDAGEVVRWFGTNTDVTELLKTEDALRESEARFRGIYEYAGTGIAITDLTGRFQSCNPAYSKMVGFTQDELRERRSPDLVHPEDREANRTGLERLAAEEIPSFEIVNRYVGKAGAIIWVHKHVSLLRDSSGKPASFILLVTDTTAQKHQEEQIHLLMNEVNHRSKNVLTLVQAIAQQTAAKSPGEFVTRFGERLKALSANQDLLVKNQWKGIQLEDLVRTQFAHFEDMIGSRIALNGPPLPVSARAAQTLGMALHELATNAAKYGALANGHGQVGIGWRLDAEGEEPVFHMTWREQGAENVAPPAKRGFGSVVICQMVERDLDAKVDLDYPPSGVTWRMACPAGEVLQDESGD